MRRQWHGPLAALALLSVACPRDDTPTPPPTATASATPSPTQTTAQLAVIPPCPDDFELAFEVSSDLYPFEPRCFEHEGHTMLAVDTGAGASGETVVFVHGNPTWSLLWADLMAHAQEEGHRVIAMDHLGFGRSNKPDVSQFDYSPGAISHALDSLVTHLDLKDIHLVVHDWGGPIGLGMAGRQAQRIRSLLITNTWAWPIDAAEPGVYHRMWDWSTQAHDQALPMTRACLVALYSARWIAEISDPSEGGHYQEVYEAYAAPWVDPVTGLPRSDTVCWPTVSLAQAILDDPAYLSEVKSGLSQLRGRPVSFVFGQGDDLLGSLRCDIGAASPCPGDLTCVCDERYLDGGASCEDASEDETNRAWLCQRPDGTVPMPALEDFVEALGSDNVVDIHLDVHAEHFVPAYPSAKAPLEAALDGLIDAAAPRPIRR